MTTSRYLRLIRIVRPRNWPVLVEIIGYLVTLLVHRWRHQGTGMRPLGFCLHCDVIRFDVLVAKVERENARLLGRDPQ